MIKGGESEVNHEQTNAPLHFRRNPSLSAYFRFPLIAALFTLAVIWLPYVLRSNNFELPILNNLANIVRISGFEDTEQSSEGIFRRVKPEARIYLPETLVPQRLNFEFSAEQTTQVQVFYQNRLLNTFTVENQRSTYTLNPSVFPIFEPGYLELKSVGGTVKIWQLQIEILSLPPLGLWLVTAATVAVLAIVMVNLNFGLWKILIISGLPGLLLLVYWQINRLTAGGLSISLLISAISIGTLLLVNQQTLFPPLTKNQFYLNIGKRWRMVPLIALAGLVVWQYNRVFGYGFFYDDYHIARPWAFGEVLGTFAGTWDPLRLEPVYFRPITVVAFYFDWLIWQYNPFGYHLTNVLLHLVAVGLVYALVLRLRLGWLAGLVGAGLFAILPYNAVTATWISQRSDALALIGVVGGLWFFVTAVQNTNAKMVNWQFILANLLFVFGLGAKEIAVVFPALCLLYLLVGVSRDAAIFIRAYLLKLLIYAVVPFVIAGIYLLYRSLVLPAELSREGRSGLAVLWQGYTQVVSETFYGISHSLGGQGATWFTVTLLLLFGSYISAKFGFRQKFSAGWESFFFGIGWILTACAPLAFLATTYGATSRVLYLPSVGLALVVAALCHLFCHLLANGLFLFRFWVGVVGIIILCWVIVPALPSDNVFVQRQYSPNDSNTLRFDRKVYEEWKGKIPERHIEFLREKLSFPLKN